MAADPAKTITVGIDGSESSHRALAWAVAHVEQFGLIQPVVAWHFPWWAASPPVPGNPAPPSPDFFEDQAREQATIATASVPQDLLLAPIITNGHAGRTLCDVAARGGLLVVGSRGRGALVESLTGSTSSFCAAHSTVPVILVPDHEPDSPNDVAPMQSIVVGVDGSENSITALAWAIEHVPDGGRIEAIHAFLPSGLGFELIADGADVFEQQAAKTMQASTEQAVQRSTRDESTYTLSSRSMVADPREALAKSGADLIVVGARGHRGVAHLLLGSVTTALAHRTSTTTAIIPG